MTIRVTLFLVAGATLSLVNFVAVQNHLYWYYLWFDMPMHFLGGLTVALGYAILPFFRIKLLASWQTLTAYLIVVLCIGLAWEFFEYVNNVLTLHDTESVILDTSIDLVLDLCGGYVGYLIAKHTQIL